MELQVLVLRGNLIKLLWTTITTTLDSQCQETRGQGGEITIWAGVINIDIQKEVRLWLNNMGENNTFNSQMIEWEFSWYSLPNFNSKSTREGAMLSKK